MNERLVKGWEGLYLSWQFATKAVKKLPAYAVRYYIDTLAADAEALRGSFASYRAVDTTMAQNQRRKTRQLTLPVLAIARAETLNWSGTR